MREFKFRAWDTENRAMASWEEIDQLDKDGLSHLVDMMNQPEKEGFILMQYTGIKDKNGADIYENDIVSITTHTFSYSKGNVANEIHYLCFFDEGAYYIGNESHSTRMLISGLPIEVKGNIYQTPELLNK